MRRGWLLAVLLVMGVACLGQGADFGRLNALKTDLVGPAIMIRTRFPVLFSWKRVSLKYERRFAGLPFLSVIADTEYQTRFEVFDNGKAGTSEWVHGLEYPRNITLFFAVRASCGVLKNPKFMFRCFAEPRLGIAWLHSRLEHYDPANAPSYIEYVNRPGLAPRFRAGVDFRFGKHLGLELAGDLTPIKILGDGSTRLELFPEFCPTVWF